MSAIHPDIEREAERLLGLAAAGGVPLRLLGGLAIRMRAPEELPSTLRRTYPDLDFVTAKGASGKAQAFFRDAGYEPHKAFNALNGQERLLFFDNENNRQVDVFVGQFSMSHKIPVNQRLEVEEETLPLAELVLTKLQIAELNEKDVRDALVLFHFFDVGEEDGDTINAQRVAELCAEDWGLWRTITGNVAACRERLAAYDLDPNERERIGRRLDELLARIEEEPKTLRWKARAAIGPRMQWYRDVGELER